MHRAISDPDLSAARSLPRSGTAERHLQIACYELLVREADACHDSRTAALVRDLLEQERGAAERMEELLSSAAGPAVKAA